jgi:lipopolysaccharide transport system ATP-binding protein
MVERSNPLPPQPFDDFPMSVSELKLAEPEPAPTESAAGEKQVVLSLENVSKRFCRDLKRSLYYGVADIAREVAGRPPNAKALRKNEFLAVEDVNLELRAGEAMGIVGINGCGKTTLMRIVAGLIKPTTGKVTVRGRLAPLLALGAGFNPILTGRENIFANMSILGLTYEEIADRFDDVVAFSEIGYAIDAPVQTYSSGMVARLGFACAITTQPDILLLDEVLAVGDLNFRRKCLEKLFAMRASGMSLVIVHHAPGMLLSIADNALYLRKGRVVTCGEIGSVIQQYERDLVRDMPAGASSGSESAEDANSESSSEAEFIDVKFESVDGGPVVAGEDAVIRAHFRIKQHVKQMNFQLSISRLPSLESINVNSKPKQVLRLLSRRDGGSVSKVEPGDYEVRIAFPTLGLRDGIYQISLKILRPIRMTLATITGPAFLVGASEASANEYYQHRHWSVVSRDGVELKTEKFLNTVEDADELLALEEKEKPEV